MNTLIVGHRGSGKSTIGRLVALRLGLDFVDVDEEIEAREGSSCAELVADDMPRFRRIERALTRELLSERDDTIVAAGGGLDICPPGPLVVWLYRDGWADTARDERDRLRPDVPWEEEVHWMEEQREPRWARWAHLRYDVSRGRMTGWAARDLATWLEWYAAETNSFASKTWVTPAGSDELDRATELAETLGLAGVEVRSDLFDKWPTVSAKTLASVRSIAPAWLESAAEHAAALDIDLEFYPDIVRADLLNTRPRRLIVSAHPGRCDPEDVEQLAHIAREVQERYPRWASHVELKYAPTVSNIGEVGLARAMVAPLRRAGLKVTLLPQGERYAGLRPLLLGENTTNYVSAALRPSRVGGHGLSPMTPLDIQDWLPHFAGESPRRWDVLIGDPAQGSQGDIWHRRAALEGEERELGYAKLRVPREEFDAALGLLGELDVRGLSVTSPLKQQVHFLCPNDAEFGNLLDPETAARLANQGAPIRTGNTMVASDETWEVTDTDERGMITTLEHLEARGLGPGTVAIFGRGGVSDALLRAIDQSDWFLAVHVGAREGWGDEAPRRVDVVIDASGGSGDIEDGAPGARAWVDLRYRDVPERSTEGELLNGDVFFEGQAEEQRKFWAVRG